MVHVPLIYTQFEVWEIQGFYVWSRGTKFWGKITQFLHFYDSFKEEKKDTKKNVIIRADSEDEGEPSYESPVMIEADDSEVDTPLTATLQIQIRIAAHTVILMFKE